VKREKYDTRYLSPKEIVLGRDRDSLLCTLEGDTHRDVQLKCAFPISHPGQYIVLKVPEKGELGIIRDMKEMDPAQEQIVFEELRRTYFIPVITKVLSVKEEFGVSEWEVETDRGSCIIKVRRRGKESVTERDDGGIILTDVDSNRYEVKDMNALDSKSRSLLGRLV
jgi:hypothetical protein